MSTQNMSTITVSAKKPKAKYPGWRTMTRAQRINAKHERIWEEARAEQT